MRLNIQKKKRSIWNKVICYSRAMKRTTIPLSKKNMYTFELSDKYFSHHEKDVFADYLNFHGLDNSIWDVFSCLFEAGDKNTRPLLLRVYKDSDLCGASIVIKCSRYGRALFNSKILSGIVNSVNIPFYLWIKFGCCMDMMSNPGFVNDPEKTEEIIGAMISYLKENSTLTLINDYTHNSRLYKEAAILPALPHALIDSSSMTTIQDYTKNHKNIRRKMRVFKNKGGEYKRVAHQLSAGQTLSLKQCFQSTAEKSVFYLPYQDLYLNAALKTSRTHIENVIYFIALLNGEFLGYQAAVKTGDQLNALHGAFNRNLKTTYHAYDLLFVRMTEFAIENGIKTIDFGAVLNLTKKKMLNKSIDMSYFLLSKYRVVQQLFSFFLKLTKIQSHQQLKFRNDHSKTGPG
jgi:Acetyltransferase (GNAT) domain